MPAISTLRSAVSGWGAGVASLLRGAGGLGEEDVLEREGFEVLFLARLGVREVVLGLFLVEVDFFVLLDVVLRAIAILLTFNWLPIIACELEGCDW